MRTAIACVVVLGAAGLAGAQPPKEPEPRYGVKPSPNQYPQNTPKAALKSVLAAVEKRNYTYLVSQLLDPKFVDDAVTERARDFLPGAEAQLAQLREFQRANAAKIDPASRVPLDPVAFRALAAMKARDLGFKKLLKDVEQKLIDDPQVLKDFRRIAREGSFADADPAATATHPEVKGRALYFKKVDNRWFLENRQVEEKKDP